MAIASGPWEYLFMLRFIGWDAEDGAEDTVYLTRAAATFTQVIRIVKRRSGARGGRKVRKRALPVKRMPGRRLNRLLLINYAGSTNLLGL
jgi:hypothetical protein